MHQNEGPCISSSLGSCHMDFRCLDVHIKLEGGRTLKDRKVVNYIALGMTKQREQAGTFQPRGMEKWPCSLCATDESHTEKRNAVVVALKKRKRTGEMFRWMTKDTGCFSRGLGVWFPGHTWQLANTCNFSPRGSRALLWSPQTLRILWCTHTHACTHAYTCTHEKHPNT